MSVAMDSFFPMPEGPGADVMFDRWRQMAMLWAPSGIVRGVGEELGAFWDGVTDQLIISSGAVWVNGVFGELATAKWYGIPGMIGLLVARFDPARNNLEVVFKEGAGHICVEDPDGWWEIPLYRINGAGSWGDERVFTPPIIPPPPVTEMPAYTPRGHILTGSWPDVLTDISPGSQEIFFWNISSHPRFIPGRNYRFNLAVGRQRVQRIGDAQFSWAGNMWWRVTDDAGERFRTFIHNGGLQGMSFQPANSSSFIVAPTHNNASFGIWHDSTAITRFSPAAVLLWAYDVGGT
jgi:hypothetical protein